MEWEEDDYICPEDLTTLCDCTCNHDQEDHDWESCTIKGCECEGHWEE